MVAHQAPLLKAFSRQESWSGLSFPSPGDLPDPGINPGFLPCRQILYHQATWETLIINPQVLGYTFIFSLSLKYTHTHTHNHLLGNRDLGTFYEQLIYKLKFTQNENSAIAPVEFFLSFFLFFFLLP